MYIVAWVATKVTHGPVLVRSTTVGVNVEMTQFDVQLKLELLLYVLYEQYKSSYIKQQPPFGRKNQMKSHNMKRNITWVQMTNILSPCSWTW